MLPENCDYSKQCPLMPYHANHGLRCYEDCSMLSVLKFIAEWQDKLGSPEKPDKKEKQS